MVPPVISYRVELAPTEQSALLRVVKAELVIYDRHFSSPYYDQVKIQMGSYR